MKKILNDLKSLKLKNFIVIFIAGIINSIGVVMFLAPVNIYDSGLSGTSMLLWELTPDAFTYSLFLLVLNIPFFIYGHKKQGTVFTVYSLFSVIICSLSAYVINYILPVDTVTSSPFAGNDLLLCSLFGGILSGIGSGLTMRFGGASDGLEVTAIIFAKKIGITVGTFIMIYNVILYIAIGIIMRSWTLPLYSIIAYAASVKAVDFIVEGLDKAKAAMIITDKADEISQALSDSYGLGLTHIPGKGFYNDTELTVIYFVVNRFQISRLKDIVMSIDADAFVTITEVTDVYGSSLRDDE